jgi:hypothetical protein
LGPSDYYPDASLRAGETGEVILHFHIGSDGIAQAPFVVDEATKAVPRLIEEAQKMLTDTHNESGERYRHEVTASVLFEIIPDCGKLQSTPRIDYHYRLCVPPINLREPSVSLPQNSHSWPAAEDRKAGRRLEHYSSVEATKAKSMNTESRFVAAALNQTCTGILVQEYLFRGSVHDGANVIFLSLDTGICLRFFFDAGVFFWKVAPPVAPPGDDQFQYRLTEPKFAQGLRGQKIVAAEFSVSSDSARELGITFEGGMKFCLRNHMDTSALTCH